MSFLDRIRQRLERETATAAPSRAEAVRLATAALLVETMRADFEARDEEREAVAGLLERHFGLTAAEAAELVGDAERAADRAVSLYEFTAALNAHLAPGEKLDVIELLWRACHADGRLDKYEDHLVRKLADLLHVGHGDLVRLRLKVEEAGTAVPKR